MAPTPSVVATVEALVNRTCNSHWSAIKRSKGRWIAEVPQLPGVLSYGDSATDAISKAEILALRVIADRLENGESEPVSISLSVPISA